MPFTQGLLFACWPHGLGPKIVFFRPPEYGPRSRLPAALTDLTFTSSGMEVRAHRRSPFCLHPWCARRIFNHGNWKLYIFMENCLSLVINATVAASLLSDRMCPWKKHCVYFYVFTLFSLHINLLPFFKPVTPDWGCTVDWNMIRIIWLYMFLCFKIQINNKKTGQRHFIEMALLSSAKSKWHEFFKFVTKQQF